MCNDPLATSDLVVYHIRYRKQSVNALQSMKKVIVHVLWSGLPNVF